MNFTKAGTEEIELESHWENFKIDKQCPVTRNNKIIESLMVSHVRVKKCDLLELVQNLGLLALMLPGNS